MPLNWVWSPSQPASSHGSARMPARVGEVAQRRVRDRLPLPQVALVAGELVQRGEPAEDHPLVVGPGDAAVVRARGGQAVVDQAARADQAAAVQPVPRPQRPVPVGRVARHPLGEPRGQRQEQLVGDRVLVPAVLVPPQPAPEGAVPAGQAVREDRPRGVEVALLAGQVAGGHPGERPPQVVVEVLVDEPGVPPSRPGERVPDDVQVGAVTGHLAVPDHRGERVGRVPPAGALPQPGAPRVPALQHAGPRPRRAAVVRAAGGGRVLAHQAIIRAGSPRWPARPRRPPRPAARLPVRPPCWGWRGGWPVGSPPGSSPRG